MRPANAALHRGLESITYLIIRFYEGAAGGLYFGAQPAHVNVDGAGATQVVVLPDLAE